MKYLLNMAIKEGISEIRLTVLSVNVKALRFYEKFGFKVVGETIDKYRGKKFKSKMMRLRLAEISGMLQLSEIPINHKNTNE